MSWITKLNEAYDCGISGASDLIPIGFTQKEVKYHVILNADGTFDTAEEFPAKTFLTIPTSPKAEGRTGDTGTPFPLADQLKYLVCEEDKTNPRYILYMAALTEWCGESDAPECLCILKSYLEQKTLLKDMTEKAHLAVKYGEGEKYGKEKDAKSMVIFSVHCADGADRIWERADVRESWNRRIANNASNRDGLCYATGAILPIMENHPKVQGNAKLVSGKDAEYPFVYKGRFAEDGSAAAVSYEVAAKAYNALDWLVQKQGFRKYGLTMVTWNTNGNHSPAALIPEEFWRSEEDEEEEPEPPDTFEAYSQAVRDAALGRRDKMGGYDPKRVNEVDILGMEAATDGRMSINYYQEIPIPEDGKDDYIARLENWYLSCRWGKYSFKQKREIIFTPKPHDIAEAVMGVQAVKTADGDKRIEKSATKQMRQLYLRIQGCITDGRLLPKDMVRSAYDRAVQPQQFRKAADNTWSETAWRETISTTCALIYKQYADEGRLMFRDANLMEQCRDRSYLYGRLLAIADFAEFDAMERQNGRMTNSVTMMPAFVQRPKEAWLRLHGKLIPYLAKLETAKADAYQNLLGAVEALFLPEERESDAPLTELFLPGYYSQRQTLFRTRCAPKTGGFRWPEERSELYGCMAAIAEAAELCASKGERCGRSNVLQYMNMLVQRPVEIWPYLHERMIPYLEKLGSRATEYEKLLHCCEERFPAGKRGDNTPLDSRFLHGYYVTRHALTETLCIPAEKRLRPEPMSRDDVFGALLGLEDSTERYVMDRIMKLTEKDFRLSNALRYCASFARKPMSTWKLLKDKLLPHQKRMPDGGVSVSKKIETLENILKKHGWDTDEALDGTYLSHFYRN